jgi:acetyl esterase/lipase
VVDKKIVVYSSDNDVSLTMDIYYPPDVPAHSRLPVVVFVPAYPNSLILERYGIKLKDAGQYVSWGQLAAASGIIAVTYETTQPEKDIYSVLAYIRINAGTLEMDGDRVGLWACSGNVPTALAVMLDGSTDIKCSVLYYGVMLDWSDYHEMEDLAKRYGSAYPCKSKSVADLPTDLPLFVVRAGEDNPQLNKSIEHFVCEATQRNLPLTFVNYSNGQHAFDLENDTALSREIIRQTLAFLQQHLSNPGSNV